MATAATTTAMLATLTANGVTTATIDANAPSDSHAYDFIKTIYETIILGVNAIVVYSGDVVTYKGNVVSYGGS